MIQFISLLKKIRVISYTLLVIWLLSSCTGINKAKRIRSLISSEQVQINLSEKNHDSIQLYYSGCSGFFIKQGENALLNDPFLSNNGPLLKLNTTNLKVDTNLVSTYFQQIMGSKYDNLGTIKALLATHTHYDHVLDFPVIIKNHLNTDSTLIGGNASLGVLLKVFRHKTNTSKPLSFINLSNEASNENVFKHWVYVKNQSIRILPILSNHAPHYFGIKFFGGKIDSTITKFPTKAAQFKQGQSLSYLIDFMKDGMPIFRIFIQGSASQNPVGFPPHLADEKQIDIAIICVASFRYVSEHPEAILKMLKPRYVILSHWENFFQKRNGLSQVPAEVPFTNVKVFWKRLQKVAKPLDIKDFTMPESNTYINVKF